jgi:hypothetical protein
MLRSVALRCVSQEREDRRLWFLQMGCAPVGGGLQGTPLRTG